MGAGSSARERAASVTRPVVSEGRSSIRKRLAIGRAGARRSRKRLRCWFEEFDPWTPRPGDYVLGSALCLLLALSYVAERGHAVQLNKQIYELEARVGSLRTETEVLAAEVTRLADRHRIVTLARKMGMAAPESHALEYIYFVGKGSGRNATAPGRTDSR